MSTKWVEALLLEMGKTYSSLTEAQIDEILANAPDVKISPEFEQRALEAMRKAQAKRANSNLS